MSKLSTCGTCGQQWETGQDGSHSCTAKMAETIRALKETIMQLENPAIHFAGDVDAKHSIEQACTITQLLHENERLQAAYDTAHKQVMLNADKYTEERYQRRRELDKAVALLQETTKKLRI